MKNNNKVNFRILYAVYDKATERCGPVFECVTKRAASREFRRMLDKTPETDKSDFMLVELGFFVDDREKSRLIAIGSDEHLSFLKEQEIN